jgi:hypothetical protein
LFIIQEHWPLICRVAHRLAELGRLSGDHVDAILIEIELDCVRAGRSLRTSKDAQRRSEPLVDEVAAEFALF